MLNHNELGHESVTSIKVPITCRNANTILWSRNSGQIIGLEKFRFAGIGRSKDDMGKIE
jgi:hypothetical protein